MLGGWWRIWIVILGVLFSLSTLIGLNGRESDYELASEEKCFPSTLETRIESEPTLDDWTALQNTPPEMLAKGEIINPRVDLEHWSCVSWLTMLKHWGYALAMAISLLAIVFIGRWILAGFKRSER